MTQTAQTSDGIPKMSLIKGWTADVLIDAPKAVVWEQVTHFKSYSEWNPFVLDAEAEFEVGKTIRFLEELQQFGQHWLEAEFLSITPTDAFVWQGHFGAAFLFSVRRSFIFEAVSDRQTRFTQIHKNAGLLIPYLAWRGIYNVTYQGYIDYNQALKQRCEHLYEHSTCS
ncbi:MAG: SRPBCC domain-containing protein [Phormidesmis sp.]